jgi:colicin import membrane protein
MTPATSLSLVPADEPIPNPVQPYVEANPASVLLYPKVREAFLAEIAAEIDAFEPDLSTKSSRAEIASLAYKVAKTKAPIEAAAKALTEDFRKRTAAVNAERNDVTGKLDALRDRARAPLDKWEEEENAREAKLKSTFDAIDAAMRVLASDTSETVYARIYQMAAIEDNENFRDARDMAINTLTAAYERLVKEEADRAELAKLRAEADERKRQDAERERAEQERVAAERREREAKEDAERAEKAAQERLATAARQAAEDAIAAERRRADNAAAEAKRAADAEIAKLAAEKQEMERSEAARIAEARRLADEELARQKDRKHRAEVMMAAKEAIMRAGPTDETVAANIVKAMVAGRIPTVSIKF